MICANRRASVGLKGRWMLVVACIGTALPAAAQTEYRNIDGGRPLRIEDADPSPRHSLEFQLAPLRVDRLIGGYYRWQLEPRVSYALFPRTELKLRMPLAYREPGADPRGGLVGVGVGGFHNLHIETARMPAFAVEGELLVSAEGSLTSGSMYGIRALSTRSIGRTRVHANAGYGTYRVRLAPNPTGGAPPVPDAPCSVQGDQPESHGATVRASVRCTTSARIGAMPHVPDDRSGSRWIFGVAADRALPLRSVLLAMDVFAERFSGLAAPVDWTTEVGVRRQLTPRTVIESTLGRRFTGASQAWFLGIGMSTSVSARLLIPETR